MTQNVTIYHNPNCSKSRSVLTRLHDLGLDPLVVDFTQQPLSPVETQDLLDKLALPVAEMETILRKDHPFYPVFTSLQTDEERLASLSAHPDLLNRPIVVTEKGAKLCRPIELVDQLL